MSVAVSLVTYHPLRSQLGSPPSLPHDSALLHQRLEYHRLVLLARGHQQRHRLATMFCPEVHFGAETSLASA
jgi:hypothetical protein